MNIGEFLGPISCHGEIGLTNWLKKVPSMENLGLRGAQNGPKLAPTKAVYTTASVLWGWQG